MAKPGVRLRCNGIEPVVDMPPDALVRSRHDAPEPAGFMAYDLTWPQRRLTQGTYDDAWLKTLFPGPAADFDWSAFNGAPRDQWADGFFQGDEAYTLEGMHPTRAVIEGRLGKIEPEAFKRGELMGHDYSINEVMHYELWFGEKEKLFWDFFSGDWRLDGTSQIDDERRILRIPTTG